MAVVMPTILGAPYARPFVLYSPADFAVRRQNPHHAMAAQVCAHVAAYLLRSEPSLYSVTHEDLVSTAKGAMFASVLMNNCLYSKAQTWSITDNIDEALFIKALSGQPFTSDKSKDTALCSAIVHLHTGLRQQHCPHAHIINGQAVTSRTVNRPCDATRTIYVPLDLSIRKALVHNCSRPHNYPMPPLTKVSYELKVSYREGIKARGCVGATVAKVDNAPSTELLLKGETPGEFSPVLQSKRVKRELVREAKQEAYPAEFDVAGR
ncbi:hypothetical protein FB451DRAFT_1404034 [Mycena latifolia]|nr:hypothetical protein FB451DRAFT_1404034 [Mycena latifolia]